MKFDAVITPPTVQHYGSYTWESQIFRVECQPSFERTFLFQRLIKYSFEIRCLLMGLSFGVVGSTSLVK